MKDETQLKKRLEEVEILIDKALLLKETHTVYLLCSERLILREILEIV